MQPNLKTNFLVLILFLLNASVASAQYKQYLKDESNPTIYINGSNGVERIQVVDEKPKKILLDRTYYWYKSNSVLSTLGGIDGKMLHGNYTRFFLNNNLKEKGYYKQGLKEGEWKEWFNTGKLNKIAHWKKGLLWGTSIYYDEAGNVLKKETYTKGNLKIKKVAKNKTKSAKTPISKESKNKITKKKKDIPKVVSKKPLVKNPDDSTKKKTLTDKVMPPVKKPNPNP